MEPRSNDDRLRDWLKGVLDEDPRSGEPLPRANPERIEERAQFLARFQIALTSLMPLAREAEAAGFSTPFLINGELLLKDERFRQ